MSNNPYQSPPKIHTDGVQDLSITRPHLGTVVIKSIGILSVGKVMAILYAAIGLILGGLIALISLAGVNGGNQPLPIFFGALSIVILPIMYGIGGFIGGIIMAVLYNLVATVAGGIELDLGR